MAIVWMAFVFIRHRNIAVTVIAVFMGAEMFFVSKNTATERIWHF